MLGDPDPPPPVVAPMLESTLRSCNPLPIVGRETTRTNGTQSKTSLTSSTGSHISVDHALSTVRWSTSSRFFFN